MTKQRGLHGRKQRQTLLAHRRQVASDTTEGLSTGKCSEADGDLLLHLDHPNIALGEVLVKRHGQILQEPENGLLVAEQTIEQGSVCFVLVCPEEHGQQD